MGKLLCDPSVRDRDRVKYSPWPPGSAVAFLNIKGAEMRDTTTRSISNREEAVIAILVVKQLVESRSRRADEIGVLTPY